MGPRQWYDNFGWHCLEHDTGLPSLGPRGPEKGDCPCAEEVARTIWAAAETIDHQIRIALRLTHQAARTRSPAKWDEAIAAWHEAESLETDFGGAPMTTAALARLLGPILPVFA